MQALWLNKQELRLRDDLPMPVPVSGEALVRVRLGLVVDEVALVGSRCGAFAPALDLLKSGLVDTRPLIGAHYPLTRAIEAFERSALPGALKVLADCQ